MRTLHRNWFDQISYHYRHSSSIKQFWNKIKMSKDRSNQSYDKISITLSDFYKKRFSDQNQNKTETIRKAHAVSVKSTQLDGSVINDYVFSYDRTVKYINKLKQRAAPGCDGVSAEHLKYSELRTQTIFYSTLKLQNDLKVDILVNHKNIWG